MVANASKEESMTGKHERLVSRVPDVAGNGLIDRRALLGRGILFAGAAATGTGGSLTGAAAEPLRVDPWPSIRAAEINVETATTGDLQAAFQKGTLTSEKLTEIYLGRIAAYDKHGPAINAIITLNPSALGEARTLDAERKAGKVRGPLHGIPIVLKDNFNTFDMPTTAGCQLLEGSIPPADGFLTKKLRDAGAIIIAKVNLSEFAGGGGSTAGATDPAILKAGAIPNGFSSMGGQTHNPHNTDYGPAGSSGGTGASIAASFAQLGFGTDTGGSVRGPSSANGIVGLRPTYGLLSRTGIVPNALSLDTAGPMARSVYDIAVVLGVTAGIDPADAATMKSAGKVETDYTKFLKVGSLKGARIGVLRGYMGQNAETDRIVEESIVTLKKLGAVIVDSVSLPDYILKAQTEISNVLHHSEFKASIGEYLKSDTKPGYPKSLDELVARTSDPATRYRSSGKAVGFKYTASVAKDMDDPAYLAIKNEGLALVKAAVQAVFVGNKLNAMIYPTSPRPASLINPHEESTAEPATASARAELGSGTIIASETGFPDLIVPAGMTKDGLPVTISFVGTAFSEPKLLGYGYDFEQATKALAVPKMTPVLPGDTFSK
jgi:amidase